MRIHAGLIATGLAALLSACRTETAPSPPPLPPDAPTANAYILPGAVDLAANAFGDKPVVVRRGERLRWRNADALDHHVIADVAALPEFRTTGILGPGGEASFAMHTPGRTGIRCAIHPQMVGTLVVQD